MTDTKGTPHKTAGDARPRRRRNWRNLQISLEIFGLMIDLHPFRWAPYAFKTKWNILGRRRSTQLWLGPLHIWTFHRDGALTLTVEINLNGSVHGKFTPDGENAPAYFGRWLTGRPTETKEH